MRKKKLSICPLCLNSFMHERNKYCSPVCFSEATRISRTGKMASVETRRKQSASGLGRKFSETHKHKISIALKGRIFSLETREKISARAKEKVGGKNPFFGKHHDIGTKLRLRGPRPHIEGDKNPNWQGGLSTRGYGHLFQRKSFKLNIRKRDGGKCQFPGCSARHGIGNRSLAIHHVDYNKDNNDPRNLISLCNSCHIKTNFNRDYWKEFFPEIARRGIRIINLNPDSGLRCFEFQKPEEALA